MEGNRGLPYDLREGIALNSSAFNVLEIDQSTSGAQEFPFGVVVIGSDKIASTLNESCVFYVGGPLDGQFVGFHTR
ncbi:MAG TPA: hypothetical protein VGB78_09315 [Thermoplasmata archaeon]